jgi:hypothetical protein
MGELAVLLANRARTLALIRTVRSRPELTIEQLDVLLAGRYGRDLARITVGELVHFSGRVAFEVRPGERVEAAILRVFRSMPDRELSSGFFVRYMGLERWTAQKMLAALAKRGALVRVGKTSSTRYELPMIPATART